jgi:hypothetical protein
MGTDKNAEDQDAGWRARQKHKDADAKDAQARFRDTPPSELLRQSEELKANHVATLRQTGIIEKLLPALKIVTYPTGITVAQCAPKDIGRPDIQFATQIPGYAALLAMGITIQRNRNTRMLVVTEPAKLIRLLENNGFTLSGALAEKRGEILVAAEKERRGGGMSAP